MKRRPPAPPGEAWRRERARICAALTEELTELSGRRRMLAVGRTDEVSDLDLRITRKPDCLVLHSGAYMASPHSLSVLRDRSLTALWWFIHADEGGVEQAVFNLSDGGDQLSLGDFAFSSHEPGVTLLPDPYFLKTRAYAELAEFARGAARAWKDRSAR